MVLAAAAAVTGDGAVVLGAAEELLEGVLGVVEDGGLEREVLFSVGFASATWNGAGGVRTAGMSPAKHRAQRQWKVPKKAEMNRNC